MIELIDVNKRYGAQAAVDGVSLRIEAGQVAALVGASGSGKSTLLRLINRLIPCDSGQILLDGRDIGDGPAEALRRRMGYVIQSIGLFPHWTVARNIATVPVLLGWPAQAVSDRVHELLQQVGLDPVRDGARYPHQLSGGQQQRVGVARALAARPSVLLMDEPFGALDPVTRSGLQQQLAELQRALGTTIVLVTHDIDEALRLAQHLVLLDHGRVVQAGSPLQVLAQPANPTVRAFLGGAMWAQRLLGLRRVGEILRPGEGAEGADGMAASGAALRPGHSLQEALSSFLASGAERLPVVDAQGQALGAVRFIDLLQIGGASA